MTVRSHAGVNVNCFCTYRNNVRACVGQRRCRNNWRLSEYCYPEPLTCMGGCTKQRLHLGILYFSTQVLLHIHVNQALSARPLSESSNSLLLPGSNFLQPTGCIISNFIYWSMAAETACIEGSEGSYRRVNMRNEKMPYKCFVQLFCI